MNSSSEYPKIDIATMVTGNHYPGGDWVYLKMYTGYRIQEIIISEFLPKLIEWTSEFGLHETWFFIRYQDPEPHLRLRIKLTDAQHMPTLLTYMRDLFTPLLETKIIWKYILDTYEPEYDRYAGATGLAVAERMFQANSELATRILKYGYSQDWMGALIACDALLITAFSNAEQRVLFMKELRDSFFNEYGSNIAIGKEINNQYRTHRSLIKDEFNEYKNDVVWSDYLNELAQLFQEGSVNFTRDNFMSFVSSVMHMSCNRLLRSHQRTYELVLYDFLYQYHNAQRFIQSTIN